MRGSNRVSQRMLIAAAAMLLLPPALTAQGRGRGFGHDRIPPGQMPPAGMCRVWFDGVPPGHQPSPMRCDVAESRAYRDGGRVIHGAVAYRGRNARPRRVPRRAYPVALPEMMWGVTVARGGVVVEVRRWLTVGNPRVRVYDLDRYGRPALVVWYDSRGHELQRWFDDDRDGRADRVAFYEGGRVARMVYR